MAKFKMEKSVQITLIIVAAVLVFAVAGYFLFTSNSMSNTITVDGQATAEVQPDLITVYYDIETTGATSKAAQDANTQIANQLTSNLLAIGFSNDDIQTVSFSIYPEYDYSQAKPTFTDYKASNSLKVEIPIANKDKVSSAVDAGTNAGAGISYINFELTPSLQQTAKAQAIKNASADAEIKAQALADGFGKRLGRLVSVSLDNFNYYPRTVYASSASGATGAAEAKAASVNINPSQQEVSASVTAIYKLI